MALFWRASAGVSRDAAGKIKSAWQRIMFESAEVYVCKECNEAVDGGLRNGELGAMKCKEMLEKATGVFCYDGVWEPELVRAIAKKANWNFLVDDIEKDGWAYWSARKFLTVCSHSGLSIIFC